MDSDAALWQVEAKIITDHGNYSGTNIFHVITTCVEHAIGMVHAHVMENNKKAEILSVKKTHKFAKVLFDATILTNEDSVTVMSRVEVPSTEGSDDTWLQ